MKNIIVTLLLITLISCNNKSTIDKEQISIKETSYKDVPFIQEYHEGFLVHKDIKEANDVKAIQPDKNNAIWIATKHGVYRKKENTREWKLMISGSDQGPAYDVRLDEENSVWVATWNGVYSNTSGQFKKVEGPKPPIAKLLGTNEGVYALGPHGVWLYKNNTWIKKNYDLARSIRGVLSDNKGGLWVGTDVGLYHCNDSKTTVYKKNKDLLSAYVRGMDYNESGELWVASDGGITIRNNTERIGEKLPKDGITNITVNTVKKAPNGTMWVGTDYGITRFTPGQKEYSVRLSKRWLMSDVVRDISFDTQGNAWIATANGVSAIKNKKMTLASKADYFYKRLHQRHVREPWIVGRLKLTIPGDTTSAQYEDDDNDGEYTSMYLAMESFRYAATKDPLAKERAKKAFDFLHLLREVTEIDGFFARTVIPVSWKDSHDMNRTYTPQELADELIKDPRTKPVEKRWHLSKDKKWKWKGDTSSDELCGHLFGYYCYYTYAADENEKKRIANHFSSIMDHLMRNNYNLVGVDGKYTRWGVWSPDILNNDPDWSPERALNSLELLSFLKFTYHITKEEKYQAAYVKLIEEDGLLENSRQLHTTNPAWETYFDIYMLMYIYPSLLALETNPKYLDQYRTHIDTWFQKHKKTLSPMLNFSYNLLMNKNEELERSIFFLKDAPLDLVDWRIDNGKREDLKINRNPILEDLQVQLRPPSEYRTMRWDANPYLAVDGNPAQEREPVYWLLPYWMGRYLAQIQ